MQAAGGAFSILFKGGTGGAVDSIIPTLLHGLDGNAKQSSQVCPPIPQLPQGAAIKHTKSCLLPGSWVCTMIVCPHCQSLPRSFMHIPIDSTRWLIHSHNGASLSTNGRDR